MNEEKFSFAFQKASDFIYSLRDSEELTNFQEIDMFFTLHDEGGIFFDSDDSKHYRESLNLIIDSLGSEIISPKYIEELYRKTILKVLDITKRRTEIPFEQRLKNELQELRKILRSKPSTYTVCYPVLGLIPDGLPIKIGNVLFCKFDDEQFAQFIKPFNDFEYEDLVKKGRVEFIDYMKTSGIIDTLVGLIEVKAIDSEAAKNLALKELSLTIYIINFFADHLPYENSYIFLPGEKQNLSINVSVISQTSIPTITFGKEVVGPISPIPLQKLIEDCEKRNWGFSKVITLLTKERNCFEEGLVSSMGWAGKAINQNKREDAFLFYAIALESLVLLDNDKEELNYRLRIRVAHLLGKDFENRKLISNTINHLYIARSKIVHNGQYQVTNFDLSYIRLYSKVCILTLLNDPTFSLINNKASFTERFNELILS
jgi:hypothetical protein